MSFKYILQMVDKEAEFSALNGLRLDIRNQIKPYLIIRRPNVSVSSQNAKVALRQRATEFCDQFFERWDSPSMFDEGLPFFIDGEMLDVFWQRIQGFHPFDAISSRLLNLRCSPTPAVSMKSSLEYKRIVHYLAVMGGGGCCLRVPINLLRKSNAEALLRETQE